MKYTKQKLTKAQKQGMLDRDKTCVFTVLSYTVLSVPCCLLITYCVVVFSFSHTVSLIISIPEICLLYFCMFSSETRSGVQN